MSETKKQDGLPDPSWHNAAWKSEVEYEWCLEWAKRHSLAFIEISEMCGLVHYERSFPMETRDYQEPRIDAVFHALRALVEIDPVFRR